MISSQGMFWSSVTSLGRYLCESGGKLQAQPVADVQEAHHHRRYQGDGEADVKAGQLNRENHFHKLQ